MLELRYSLVIEVTEDPEWFGVYCPALEPYGACTAIGTSIEEARKNGLESIEEFITELRESGIEPPPAESNPVVRVVNEMGYLD